MEITTSDDIALKSPEEILIDALSQLSLTDIFKSKELETCFREFLERGTTEDWLQFFPQSHKAVLSNTNYPNTLSSFKIVPRWSPLNSVDDAPSSKPPSPCSASGDTSFSTAPVFNDVSSDPPASGPPSSCSASGDTSFSTAPVFNDVSSDPPASGPPSSCSASGDTSFSTAPVFNDVSSNPPASKPPSSCHSLSNSIPTITASSCAGAPPSVAQPRPNTDSALSGPGNSIVKYFTEQSIAPYRAQRLARLIRSFMVAKPLDLETYRNLWCDKGRIFNGSELGVKRIGKLHRGRIKIEKGRTEYECVARLCLMFMVNDVAHYSLTTTRTALRLRENRSRMTAALEHISLANNIPKESLVNDRKKNRNYFHMLSIAGPGSLLEIASEAVSDWEVKASKEDIELVLEYRKTHLPELHKRAGELNGVGARTIVDGLLEYGWTFAEATSSPTPFLKLVRGYLDQNLMITTIQDDTSATQPLGGADQSSKIRSNGGDIRGDDPNRKLGKDRSSLGSGNQTPKTCLPPDAASLNSLNGVRFNSVEQPPMARTSTATIELPSMSSTKTRGWTGCVSSTCGSNSTHQSVVIDPSMLDNLETASYLPGNFGSDSTHQPMATDSSMVDNLETASYLPGNFGSDSTYQPMVTDSSMMDNLETAGYLPDNFGSDSTHQPIATDSSMVDNLETAGYLPDDFGSDSTHQPMATDSSMVDNLETAGYLPDDFGSDSTHQPIATDSSMVDNLETAGYLPDDFGSDSTHQPMATDSSMVDNLETASYLPGNFGSDSTYQPMAIDSSIVDNLNTTGYLPDNFGSDLTYQPAAMDPSMVDNLEMASYLPDNFGSDSTHQPMAIDSSIMDTTGYLPDNFGSDSTHQPMAMDSSIVDNFRSDSTHQPAAIDSSIVDNFGSDSPRQPAAIDSSIMDTAGYLSDNFRSDSAHPSMVMWLAIYQPVLDRIELVS